MTNPETNRGAANDGVNTAAVSGGNAIFQIVLAGTQDFSSPFWQVDRDWTDIFKNATGTSDLSDWASVFTSFSFANGKGTLGAPSAYGSFSLGGNTLSWNAVPEPGAALTGLLIGAGLLRRRR